MKPVLPLLLCIIGYASYSSASSALKELKEEEVFVETIPPRTQINVHIPKEKIGHGVSLTITKDEIRKKFIAPNAQNDDKMSPKAVRKTFPIETKKGLEYSDKIMRPSNGKPITLRSAHISLTDTILEHNGKKITLQPVAGASSGIKQIIIEPIKKNPLVFLTCNLYFLPTNHPAGYDGQETLTVWNGNIKIEFQGTK